MAKRSPFEQYRKRQQAANSKYLDIWVSQSHPCVCGHPQGFHWPDDEGECLGKCGDYDCDCTAFAEDAFAAAQLAAGVLPVTTARTDSHTEAGDDDALARAMRAKEQREVDDEEVWDRAVHAKRPNPIGKPQPDMLDNPAVLDALRNSAAARRISPAASAFRSRTRRIYSP
jgi:hypothetical protein